jgi:hypothetical protein
MMTSKGDVWVGDVPSLACLPDYNRSHSSKNPSSQVVENCTKEVDEVIRVLCAQTGIFLYFTFGQPHFRRRYLQREGTSLEIRQLGDAFHYYFYILKMSKE